MATTKSKTTAAKKTSAKKPSKTTASSSHKASGKLSPEEKLAQSTIKILDQASEALRKTITSGATTGTQAREAAKKKAQSILAKAHSTLGKTLDEGFSAVGNVLKKLP